MSRPESAAWPHPSASLFQPGGPPADTFATRFNMLQELLEAVHKRVVVDDYGGDWQPISSAPQDGTRILAWDPYYMMRIARWEPREIAEILDRPLPEGVPGQWMQDLPSGTDPGRGEIEKPLRPTFWMRLPQPPKDMDP